MRCDACDHWLCKRTTVYDDGKEVVNFEAPPGMGQCENGITLKDGMTPADFGCAKFEQSSWDHVTTKTKVGLAWQHWEMIQCPDCIVQGHSVGCQRCQGTGKCRKYDDGYIGEERTRLHPEQKKAMERAGELGPPTCLFCKKTLDINWVACPHCGARTNKPSEREVIDYVEQGQGTTDAMLDAARRKREVGQAAVPGEQAFNPPPESPA